MAILKCFNDFWSDPGPDRGWSWVVLFSAWTTFFIIMAPIRSSGVLYNAMVSSMNLSLEQVSWPFSLSNAVSGFSGLLGGYLSEHYSCRTVNLGAAVVATLSFLFSYFFPLDIYYIIVTYGVFFGMAHGVTLPILQMVVNEYFLDYRTTATGISVTGVSVVGLVAPVMTNYLIQQYDIRGCFLVLASLIMQMLVVSALLRPRNPQSFPEKLGPKYASRVRMDSKHSKDVEVISEAKTDSVSLLADEAEVRVHRIENIEPQPESNGSVSRHVFSETLLKSLVPLSLRTLLKRADFVLFCVVCAIIQVTYFSYLSFAVAHGFATGLSLDSATLLVSCYSAGEFLARFGVGFLVDKKLCSANALLAIVSCLAGISLIFFGATSIIMVAFGASFAFGLTTGSYVPLRGTILAVNFGVKSTAFGIGIIHLLCGVLFLLVPTLIGALTSSKRTFGNVCYVMGSCCVIAGVALAIEHLILVKRNKSPVADNKNRYEEYD